jgi:hypothetical protein
MAHIDGPVLAAFKDLVAGVHNFDDKEMDRLDQMAHEVKAIVQASLERQDRAMMARGQFKQMGGPYHQTGVINEGVPVAPQPTSQSAPPNEIDQSHRQWE